MSSGLIRRESRTTSFQQIRDDQTSLSGNQIPLQELEEDQFTEASSKDNGNIFTYLTSIGSETLENKGSVARDHVCNFPGNLCHKFILY